MVREAISLPTTIAIAVVSVAVVLVSSAVAWNGDVPAWEAKILVVVNGLPGWLEPPMWTLQQVGVIAAPVLGGVVVAWVARRWEYVIPFVLVLPLKLIFEKAVVKEIVERERPFVSVGSDVIVRGPAFEGLSFPSGHTTTATAFAILLFAFLPRRWRLIPLGWAALVAVARVYFGEHNALDVVAGAAMGTLFAVVLWFAVLNRFVARDSEEELA